MKDKNKIIYRLQPNNSLGRVGKGGGGHWWDRLVKNRASVIRLAIVEQPLL